MYGAPRVQHAVGAQHQVALPFHDQGLSRLPEAPTLALHSLWPHLSPWLPAGQHRWCPRPRRSVSGSLQRASVSSGHSHPVSERALSTPFWGSHQIASMPLLLLAAERQLRAGQEAEERNSLGGVSQRNRNSPAIPADFLQLRFASSGYLLLPLGCSRGGWVGKQVASGA